VFSRAEIRIGGRTSGSNGGSAAPPDRLGSAIAATSLTVGGWLEKRCRACSSAPACVAGSARVGGGGKRHAVTGVTRPQRQSSIVTPTPSSATAAVRRARFLGSVATPAVCTYRSDDANGALSRERNTPNENRAHLIEEQINRVDRQRSLAIGISCGVTTLWCLYRLISLLYIATTLSSVGWSPVSLVFPFVLWGVIGAVAVIAAVLFLTRYAKRS
jgi:hypothetical protein